MTQLNKNRIFVTGIGIVNPLGIGKDNFWQAFIERKLGIRSISKFDTSGLPIHVAGEILNFSSSDFMDKRLSVKTDPFTHYAIAATQLALEDAKLKLDQENRHRIGIWFGNNAGGWELCQRGFYELYNFGSQMVNPWQATAWFPTAAQGFTSIKFGIYGYSKSFVCDRASGASALYFALLAIKMGLIDVALVGGAEAPLTRFASICYHETGEMSTEKDASTAYRPFDQSGIVLAEGSTVLVLESEKHLQRTNAKVYGEVISSTMNIEKDPALHERQVEAMTMALKKGELSPKDLELIIAEGCGSKQSDEAECRAILELFGTKLCDIPITSPKASYGHLYGASAVTELVCGLLGFQDGILPITLNAHNAPCRSSLNIVTDGKNVKYQNFLLNSRSRDGVNASFLIKKV